MILKAAPALAFGVFVGSAQAASLTGTYVGTGSNVAIMLQLVDNGGQLSGRYEEAELVGGPKISRYSALVSGNANDKTVVLQWKSPELLAQTFSASGTTDGASLALSGLNNGATFRLHLTRSNEEEFRSHVAALADRVNQAKQEAFDAGTLKWLERLSQYMQAFSAIAPNDIKKLLPAEQMFRRHTEAMATALRKQQAIPRSDYTAVARGQIGLSINQANGNFYQLHNSLESEASKFKEKIRVVSKESEELSKRCENLLANPAKADGNLASVCSQMKPVAAEFKNNVTQLASTFQRIEAVWQEENRKQEAIVKASDAHR